MTMTKPDKGDTQRQHVFETMAKLYGWTDFIEIGVRKGQTGLHLLAACPELRWLGVDPYAVYDGSAAEPGFYDHRGENREAQYHGVMQKLAAFGDRAFLLREFSAGAAEKVEDRAADCVFIDADHRYEFVKQDIALWRGKVKPGGWLTGHDIDWEPVARAVAEEFPDALRLPDMIWAVRL